MLVALIPLLNLMIALGIKESSHGSKVGEQPTSIGVSIQKPVLHTPSMPWSTEPVNSFITRSSAKIRAGYPVERCTGSGIRCDTRIRILRLKGMNIYNKRTVIGESRYNPTVLDPTR